MEDKKLKLPGYKVTRYTCEKCGCKTTVESDFLSDSQIKASHKCIKGKDKQ